MVGTTVVAWPPMLTSGAVDPSSRSHDDTVRLRRAAAPTAAARARPPPPFEPDRRRRRRRRARAARRARADARPAAALGRDRLADRGGDRAACVAGGGYYAYTDLLPEARGRDGRRRATPRRRTGRRPPPPRRRRRAPKKSVRDTVGEYLATKPDARGDAGQGARNSPRPATWPRAFLVWRRAAEAGNAPAQLELAAFYDPLTTPAQGGFTPDGARAADWYERAALAGNAEAQRKFGLLLAKGGAGLPADHGQGQDLAAAGGGAERRRRQEGAGRAAEVASDRPRQLRHPACAVRAPCGCAGRP